MQMELGKFLTIQKHNDMIKYIHNGFNATPFNT